MVRSGEPLWLPEDADAVVALLEYDDNLCGGCGQPRDESFDKGHQYAYEVEEHRCHACAAKSRQERKRSKQGETWDPSGIYTFPVEKPGRVLGD